MPSTGWMTAAVLAVLAVLGASTIGLIAMGPANTSLTPGGSPMTSVHLSVMSGPTCSVTVTAENSNNTAIQGAINLYGSTPGSVVCIGAGTFPEQLTISGTSGLTLIGNGNSSTFLAPTSASANAHDLDNNVPVYALIAASNDVDLTIENLAINGSHSVSSVPGCDGFVGIYYADSSGVVTGTTVSAINQDNGCQTQNAIYANNGYFQTNTATAQGLYIANNTVSNYGKNGITCNDPGLTCAITENTVSTTPMVLGLSATNGIQFYGATGTITGNSVSGNVYLPSGCTGGNYFFTPTHACPNAADASGILLYAPGNGANVSGNLVSDNQLGIAAVGGPASVWFNTVRFASVDAIATDFNSSIAWLGSPVFATGPYVGVVGDNTIADANVGVLVYDNNATLDGNHVSASNVSFAVATDLAVNYHIDLAGNVADSNVSGALLGDIASFETGVSTIPFATYTVTGNTFVNASVGGSAPDGVLITGAGATVSDNTVTGFNSALQVILTPSGDLTATGNLLTAPAVPPSGAGGGAYFFAGNATFDRNTVSGYSWMNGPGWWPNSQTAGIFGQCLEVCHIENNSVTNNAIGIAVISYVYGPSPAPSWPYAAPASEGPIVVNDNTVVDSGAFGIALELNQGPSATTANPHATIWGNTVDNTLTGAVGLMADQGTYAIANNVFLGTSLTGNSGSSQPTGVGSIGTAPIQVLNANDYLTWAALQDNEFFGVSSPDLAVLNLTGSGGFAHAGWGESATFTESGLPGTDTWYLNLTGAPPVATTGTSFVIDLTNGTTAYTAQTSDHFYHASTPSSSVSVAGAAVDVSVPFVLTTYAATFTESGLISGTSWSVTIGADTMTSTGTSIGFELTNGSYSYTVSPVTDYALSGNYHGSFSINGAGYSNGLTFVLQAYTVTFTESGLPASTDWSVTLGAQPTASSTTTQISFQSVNGTFSYTIGTLAGYTTTYTGNVMVSGGPQSVSVTWTQFTYQLTFTESGLAPSTSWSISADSTTLSSTGTTIAFTVANGTYPYTVGAVPDYAVTPSGSAMVNGADTNVGITFVLQSYHVTFHEKGLLPHGTSWTVTLDGTPMSSTTKNIVFSMVNGTYPFQITPIAGWHTATGGYAGTVTVNGTAVTVSTHWEKTTYKVTFVETGLQSHAAWQVTVGSNTIVGATSQIIFHLANKTSYHFTVSTTTGPTPTPASGTFTVNGATVTEHITFS